jgi:CRISPR-associated protein Cmr2
MTHLFLFTIGPVQSFIAQARKTQDLYAGSKILSDLITFAMDTLESLAVKTNIGFIFPNRTTDSKPNRFIAIVNADKAQIKKIGEDLEIAVMNEFATGEDFGRLVNVIFDCEDQFRDFLKINWVAKKFDEKLEKYKDEIATLERLMGAVKNTRQFASFPETGRKCAVNGEYNVRFYRRNDKDTSKTEQNIKDKKLFNQTALIFNNTKSYKLVSQGELQKGEGICGITFLKRLYEKTEFSSTANIAVQSTLNELVKENTNLLNEFALCLGENNWKEIKNGQLFYKENLNPDYFKDQDLNNGGLDCAISKLNKLYEVAKDSGLQFSKYYAVLVFDADSMGKALQSVDRELHTNLSSKLGEFATWAKDTYFSESKGNGKAVYAGGDDFLGFVNLNYLFDSLKDLREKFTKMVSTPLSIDLSFSAGIAIAHYKTPLSEVLNYARAMEKKAKNIDGKNSFAIAVLKHSGEIHETVFKWTYQSEGETLWTTEVAKTLTNYLASKELSDKFITNLSMEFENLMHPEGKLVGGRLKQDIPELNGIFKVELARLVKRASKLDDKKLKPLIKDLFSIYEKSKNENKLSLQNFLNFLHICEFIGRNLNISQPITTKQNVD